MTKNLKTLNLAPSQVLEELLSALEACNDNYDVYEICGQLHNAIRKKYSVDLPGKFNDPNVIDYLYLNTVDLEKVFAYLKTSFDLSSDIRLIDLKNELYHRADAYFKREVFKEQLETMTVKHPSDWWQAFKERWFPNWLLEKYPVVYTEHKFSFEVMYPDFKPAVQGNFYRVAKRG